MKGGFGKDFYRKGNSVKRSGPFSEPPDSENRKVAVQIHFPKSAPSPVTSPLQGVNTGRFGKIVFLNPVLKGFLTFYLIKTPLKCWRGQKTFVGNFFLSRGVPNYSKK